MNLLKISLIISFLGIFFLLFLSQNQKQVNSYQELSLGENVITKARIVSINSYDSFSVIKLNNNITLTCNCKFKQNETIIAEGKVTEYKNNKQIQATKIAIKNDI